MREMKLASEFTGKFNKEKEGYLLTFTLSKVDVKTKIKCKRISNLDFSDFSISDLNLDKNIEHIVFKNCKFHNLISYESMIDMEFQECRFNDIKLHDISTSIALLNCKIRKFGIFDSEIASIISLKNDKEIGTKIGTLVVSNSTFSKGFNVENIIINDLTIKDTDFNEIIDFSKVTVIDKCDFHEITFKGFALFDECVFDSKVIFKYVTFESFSHFRNSTFNAGLDLEYCSSKEEMNFFGAKNLDNSDSKNQTSQETYRIIKHNFEKLNNRIEANKYHSLELEKRQEEIEHGALKSGYVEFIPLLFNYTFSQFSSNWLWVLISIVFMNFVNASFIATGLEIKVIYFLTGLVVLFILLPMLYLAASKGLAYFSSKKWIRDLNRLLYLLITVFIFSAGFGFVIYNLIFSQEKIFELVLLNFNIIGSFESYEKILDVKKLSGLQAMVVLVNKVFLGYLYYMLITSIRKDTRK